MDGAASKALVQEWFAKGITSPAGQAVVTDGFRWIGPRSMAELFDGDGATLHGPQGLAELPHPDRALYRGHEPGSGTMNVHFLIAEVREHADTHYSHEVCLGTPQKRAGVHGRLATLRAGGSV